jgi:hypothetical protein
MKVKVLATVIAATFMMGAVGTADAGLFNCGHKKSCCRTYTYKSCCKTKCAPVSCCKTVSTCCSPRPNCCATRCATYTRCGSGCATGGCAPASGSGAAPQSDDVESIPAPPKKDTNPPKPNAET